MSQLSIKTIKEILNKHNLRPTKFLGQHFLISQNALNKMIEAAELKSTDVVLEIGPGLGILTQELVKRAGQVVAVEKDARFIKILQERFKNFKNLEIIHDDILNYKGHPCSKDDPCNYKLIANIPYNITSDILIKFLQDEPRPERLVFMIQKEVADRVLERDGRSSRLSIFVNYFGKPELVVNVPAAAFYPPPKVDSAIIKITPYFEAKLRRTPYLPRSIESGGEGRKFSFGNREREKVFFDFIRLGFSHPRKKLISNLKICSKRNVEQNVDQIQGLPEVFEKLNLDQNFRPENLHLEDWIRLFDVLNEL